MQCRICHNERGNQEFTVLEMMFGSREPFIYFQCGACECLQIATFPSDISKHYGPRYYSFSPARSHKGLKRLAVTLRDRFAVLNRPSVAKLLYARFPHPALRSLAVLSPNRDTRILDVGCGAGALLHSLREMGWSNLLGVDPFNPAPINYPNGLQIEKAFIEDIDKEWDIVIFNHSFEHISDPRGTLRAVHRLLRKGGTCLLRLPTVPCYAWDHYGVNWVQVDAPRHFYLHSPRSLELLSNDTGFHLASCVYDSTGFQFWGSEQYKRGIPLSDPAAFESNGRSRIFSKQQIAAFSVRANQLNLDRRGDQAVFYLTRE